MAQTAKPVQLKAQTVEAFGKYIRGAEAGMDQTLKGTSFLWSDATAERAQQVRAGQVVAQFWSGKGPAKVPDGLIHDWIGTAFVPGTTVGELM